MPINFGSPLRVPPASRESQLILNPIGGVNSSDAPTDIDPGQSPSCDNMIFRYGTMEPRPCLTSKGTNPQPFHGPILGGFDSTDVRGANYPVVSGQTQFAWYTGGGWSLLSYVSSFGLNAPPNAGANDYWDSAQIYDANTDQMMVVFANNSYQTLYCWDSGTSVFSTMTGAPMAKTLDVYDNYILAGNIASGNSIYVQRIQWNDRGSASSWTGGLSGFEDLLAMHGEINRVMGQENRVVILGDQEVWQGIEAAYPDIFSFQPLDRNIGCPYPWTAAITPAGIFFLGRDLQIYWLSKFGGPAQPVGHRVLKVLRDTITNPERAFAVYDSMYNEYQLYYAINSGTGYPQRALFLNIAEATRTLGSQYQVTEAGSWAPQSFDLPGGSISLTRGFDALNPVSSGTSWGGCGTLTWAQASQTWGQMGGTTTNRAVHLGTSTGTIAYLSGTVNSDFSGVAVQARWRSLAYSGYEPTKEKTITEVRLDYQADSSSSMTLRVSTDQGGTFGPGIALNLPVCSQESQTRAFPYSSARYPCIEVLSEGQRWRLMRIWTNMRVTGR